jgi:nucleoside-diphosphate-sugar epimerase
MQVFVIGATGALGRRIVTRLLSHGHGVTALGRSAARLDELSRIGARPLSADLFDAATIQNAMRGHDAVINVATRVPKPNRMLMPGAWKDMDRVRSEGAAIVAKAVMANKIERLVQESFAPIYPDRGDQWITEQTVPTPARYNRSVVTAEEWARRAGSAGCTSVILRFGMLYGPGDAFAQQVLSSIRKGWAPFVGDSSGYVSLVTHDDAAEAAVAALAVPAGTYNIVDNEPMTRRALVDSIAQLLGVKAPRFLPTWVAKLGGSLGETLSRSQRISNRKFREVSDWTPATPKASIGFRAALDDAKKEVGSAA